MKSPVVKMTSVRTVLGLAASLDLELEQLNVKTAFLHGDLNEEIYMEQPEGFEVKGKEDLVCRLKKNLYGLKQNKFWAWRSFVTEKITSCGCHNKNILNVYLNGSI